MTGAYQLIILGDKKNSLSDIVQQLEQKLFELHITNNPINNLIKVIDSSDIEKLSIKNPAICLYFGNKEKSDTDILDRLLLQNILILPLVSDIKEATKEIPKNLSAINCFEYKKTR